jgi:hypothetical protein
MARRTLNEHIARLAHACWCRTMRAKGWTAGPQTDRDWRVHEALRPYDELKPAQREVLDMFVAHDQVRRLLSEVAHDSLFEPELTEDDIHIGTRVKHDLDPGESMHGCAERGTVISWVPWSPGGRIHLIRVRWDDGIEEDHPPVGELILLDENDEPVLR